MHDNFDPDADWQPPPRLAPRIARKPHGTPLWLLILASAGAGFAVWFAVAKFQGLRQPALHNADAAERAIDPGTPPDAEETQGSNIFESVSGSVVNVDTFVRVRQRNFEEKQQQTGTGSGFFWDDDGRIVTNFHVVREAVQSTGSRNAASLRVVLADRSAYPARLVGIAPDSDLAVLLADVPRDKIKKIRVGQSAGLKVGRKAFAIGNPFGLSLTMTQGIISALDREIESPTGRMISGAIQTDAPINPGNSGGPLLDKDGRLIGVNTSIATAPGSGGGNVGIGFAIPVDVVNSVVTELIRRGEPTAPDIGIKLVEQWRLQRAGLPPVVMIGEVDPESPAAQAGLRGPSRNPQTGETTPGDLILSVDGKRIADNKAFVQILSQAKVGDILTLTVERNGERREVKLTVRGV